MEINPYQSPRSLPVGLPARSGSRPPDAVSFTCERCDCKASIRRLRHWGGKCKRCRGESWALTASYTDYELTVGWRSLLDKGTWFSRNAFSNQVTVGNVSAELAASLVESRRTIKQRVGELLSAREQERLIERGAETCMACGLLFVPAPDKPWTGQGYCSKACAAASDVVCFNQDSPAIENERVASRRLTVYVTCPAGHAFEVLATFSGCFRPCPTCGAKFKIP